MPHGIAAAHPDDFVDHLFDFDEDEAFAAAARMRGRLRAPSMTSSGVYPIDREGRAAPDGRQAATEHNFTLGLAGGSRLQEGTPKGAGNRTARAEAKAVIQPE